MKTLLLFTIFCIISATALKAQDGVYGQMYVSMYYDSSMSIDPSSGESYQNAFTLVDAESFYEVAPYVSATSSTYSTLGSDTETDNCGPGCASAYAYGQIPSLGTSYTETGSHFGFAFDFYSYVSFEYNTETFDTETVPGETSASLQSISINPYTYDMYFNYSLSGPDPFSQVLVIGGSTYGTTIFNAGGSSFYYNQNYFPNPVTTNAQLSIMNYGFYSYSPACTINITNDTPQGGGGGYVPYDSDSVSGLIGHSVLTLPISSTLTLIAWYHKV